jgi:hypothetical protein
VKPIRAMLLAAVLLTVFTPTAAAEGARDAGAPPYARWKNGPQPDPAYFPIAVWLQAPKNAAKFKAIGVNLYVGLWKGPTDEQLQALREAAMPVVCHQNELGLKHRDDRLIVGWMHGDEPDNAQPMPDGKGYGPPILPERIVADYGKIRAADSTRPVLLNLGQGVAWDAWHGRGVRTNKPEDYPAYVKGCDIASFDIYPANHDKPAVARNLWYVARGVDRLREASGGQKIVWNCIECTPISDPARKPTPRDVRAEVWMSLIRGSRGLIYFVHVFKPRFIEAGLLADPEMARAVAAINKQILELAPVLNSPTVEGGMAVASSAPGVPINAILKRHGGSAYVFAVSTRDAPAKGAFSVAGLRGARAAEVLGEGRTVDVKDGRFEDAFEGYAVHLYRIELGK